MLEKVSYHHKHWKQRHKLNFIDYKMRYLAYSVILSMLGYGLGESSLHELKPGTEKEASTNEIYFFDKF